MENNKGEQVFQLSPESRKILRHHKNYFSASEIDVLIKEAYERGRYAGLIEDKPSLKELMFILGERISTVERNAELAISVTHNQDRDG